MDDVFILNENYPDASRAGLIRLHDAVVHREAGRPEVSLSLDELLARFRAADPTRNAACLPWLLKTYVAGGYLLEDLSKAHDTLVTFARLRGLLPNTSIIDGETRNPRKLGSHMTLASLWSVVAPFVEAERLAQEEEAGEQVDTDKERALSQSRVIHRSNRMVVAVPLTKEASCWWGQGTQWCTAARNNNAFERYHTKAPLIVVCLRKNGDLPACKLQLHVHADDMQFMDENDARVSLKFILERWQDLKVLLHWAVTQHGLALTYVPEPLRTEAICTVAVNRNGLALEYVPKPLRTKAICTVAVGRNGVALQFIPKPLRTKAMCLTAVGNHGQTLKSVPQLLSMEAMYTADAVGRNGRVLRYVPSRLRTETICLTAVGRDGLALYYVPEPLRTEAMCLAAVKQNGLAIKFIPELLRTEAIYLAAIGRDGMVIHCLPKHLLTEAMCSAAVMQNGWALQYVPEPLRTEAICTVAVTQTGWALQYVPNHLRTEAICTVAVTQNGWALQYVPELLRAEVTRLTTVGRNEHKSLSVTCEANMLKSHDFALADLEDCLNNSTPGQDVVSPFSQTTVRLTVWRWLYTFQVSYDRFLRRLSE